MNFVGFSNQSIRSAKEPKEGNTGRGRAPLIKKNKHLVLTIVLEF